MSNTQTTPNGQKPISIRPCTTHAEFRGCVSLQIAVWNFDPLEVVSSHILAVASETGGQVLGAFDDERMIGFAQAFAAGREGKLYLHSHMVAVLPEYQNHGVGRMLKMAQREEALARGIERIEWTFDPLQSLNAYFNVVKLGAIMRRYIPDFYGSSSSPLHANLPTDRLVAEWRLTSSRVLSHLAGNPRKVTPVAEITVPRNIADLKNQDPAEASRIHAQVRRQFQECFAKGFVVTGFEVNETGGRYLLGKSYED